MRRAEDLNGERIARLDTILAAAERKRPPKLEDIIDAFTHPLLDRSTRGSPGWKSYFALIAEVNNSPEFGGVLMTRYFDPVVQRFIEAIRLALPGSHGPRRVLGLPLPLGRAPAHVRRDRPHRQALRRRVPLERSRQRARAPGAVLRRGLPRAVPAAAHAVAGCAGPAAAGPPVTAPARLLRVLVTGTPMFRRAALPGLRAHTTGGSAGRPRRRGRTAPHGAAGDGGRHAEAHADARVRRHRGSRGACGVSRRRCSAQHHRPLDPHRRRLDRP